LEIAEQAANISKQIGDQRKLYRARFLAGQAYFALNKLNQSRQAFEEVIQAIEIIRNQVDTQQLQQRFFEDKVDAYQSMVELLIAQNDNSEALAYAERAKARVILDVLQGGRINIS